MTAENGERGGSSDVQWKTVPQMCGYNGKRSVADSGQTSKTNEAVHLLSKFHETLTGFLNVFAACTLIIKYALS